MMMRVKAVEVNYQGNARRPAGLHNPDPHGAVVGQHIIYFIFTKILFQLPRVIAGIKRRQQAPEQAPEKPGGKREKRAPGIFLYRRVPTFI